LNNKYNTRKLRDIHAPTNQCKLWTWFSWFLQTSFNKFWGNSALLVNVYTFLHIMAGKNHMSKKSHGTDSWQMTDVVGTVEWSIAIIFIKETN